MKDGEVQEISFEGVPSFYQESKKIKVPDVGEINVDIAFGGLYYVFVNPDLTMTGEICKETKVGGYKAIIPKLSAMAYVIGLQHCIMEKDDPYKTRFSAYLEMSHGN
jgi:proline racemase